MTALRDFDTAFDVIQEAHRRARGGGYLRKTLDSPCYDYLFQVIERDGERLCVMRPGFLEYDPDYFEIIPAMPQERPACSQDVEPVSTVSPLRAAPAIARSGT